MTDEEKQELPVYTPAQAARYLGITVFKLKYHRLRGDIRGTDVGNTTLFTKEQLDAADLTPKKPGPKGPRKKGDENAAGHRWDSCLPDAMTLARVG